ncbi:MAG: proline dehydrogenase, partial [Deltaproteobacteria bacterium]
MLPRMDRMPDVSALRDRLGSLHGRGLSAVDAVAEAATLAADLQRLANAGITRAEAKELAVLARLMEDPAGRVFTTAMTDQALRARVPKRVAEQLAHLVGTIGAPRYLTGFDRLQLRAFRRLSGLAPKLLVPAVLRRIKGEMGRYVIDGAPARVGAELHAMLRRGTHPNLNQLGEAILGEQEAEARLARYLDAVRREDVAAVSIKISSIASQLDLLAFDASVDTLADRLRRLFHTAHGSRFVDLDGTVHPTLVTLDMEEYRDLHLTLSAFERVLEEEELLGFAAGIVLQAYLPDSHEAQRRLVAWSQRRVARGGAPIRLRLVKGANLAMERVDAAVHGWKQAPYATKAEVDASFKRMVHYGVAEGRLDAVRLAVASHNVFDLAYGLVVRALVGAPEHLAFEMLEGISASLRRVVRDVAGDVLIYAPAVVEDELQSAIAYLIRRLDENTAPENFLRHVFELEPGTPAWEEQERRFVAACRDAATVAAGARRDQDRRAEPVDPDPDGPFVNEPDTDWTLPHNRAWVEAILARWREREPVVVGPVVAGEELTDGGAGVEDGFDPGRPGAVPYRWVKADEALLERALVAARDGAAA